MAAMVVMLHSSRTDECGEHVVAVDEMPWTVDIGFRVLGFGFWVWLGVKVRGRVSGFGFRVSGFGFRVQGWETGHNSMESRGVNLVESC